MSQPRKNPLLAHSEYVPPGAFIGARRDLMERVRSVFPEMLTRLSTDVFPAYEALVVSGFNVEAILGHPRPFEKLPKGSSLRAALSKWASEFNAEQDWFLADTIRTLRDWHTVPLWRSELRCHPAIGVTDTHATGKTFTVDFPGWEMSLFTWGEYTRLMHKHLDEKLKEYREANRGVAELHGLILPPRQYSQANLEWFVLYQFEGLSLGEIADRSNLRNGADDSGIRKGVETAKKLIGWTVPKKKKTGKLAI